MSHLSGRFLKVALILALLLSCVLAVQAQAVYTTNGTEFPLIGQLPGDQVKPDLALSSSGGLVVWQDNITDGGGWGISARRLDATLSGTFSTFRVNAQGSNDQQNARVALLRNGGATFVWQGGRDVAQHVYARFLSSSNTWLSSSDLTLSTFTNVQVNPAVTVLSNGNVVVVWSSFNQAGTNSLMDVYAKILSPVGAVVKAEFLVNQFTPFNQRNPQVAALKNGGFVVVWISEQQLLAPLPLGTNSNFTTIDSSVHPSVDVYGRLFTAGGVAAGNEFRVSDSSAPCANPAVAPGIGGNFIVAWSGRDVNVFSNGWDVYWRSFGTNGVGGTVSIANQHIPGNQYAPRIASIGSDFLCVWTSMSQDGSREGVYGRYLRSDGSAYGDEFLVNTTTISQQMQPAVASNGDGQFAVVWTGFTGLPNNFDLFAQRYVNVDSLLVPMPAPFVSRPFLLLSNVYQPQLQVSWAPLAGITISNYEVVVDGGGVPFKTTSNLWVMTAANGLTTNDTHSFQVRYVKPDGQRPELSPGTIGSTWGGAHWQGIPFEWMQNFYGNDIGQWPSIASAQTIRPVFLSGGNPLDQSSWLTTKLVNSKQGTFLSWNTQPGFTYQVQASTNFTTWINLGSPRFAAGTNDSIYLGAGSVGFYRVLLMR